MKIAVMGAGAVGSYFGGLLAKAGEEVTFIARGKHLQAMKEKPLVVHSISGDFEVQVKATDNPAEVGPVDLILFTVKSYDTEQAIEQCKPLIKDDTILISPQNGVDNEEKIEKITGKEKILPTLTRIGVSVESPGVVKHPASGKIEFGEESGEDTERTKKIKELFDKAGIVYIFSETIRRAQWKKFLWNVAYNQICTISKKTCGEVISCPETKELVRLAALETVNVGKAKGISLDESDAEAILTLSEGFKNFKPSMLQDFEKSKRMEVEAFGGVVVRYGKELGIPTPVNYCLYSLLELLSKG